MTIASSIITDAYRESNLIPMGNTPTVNQQTEALGRLNSILLSVIGNEVGDPLDDITIGGSYDQSSLLSVFIPDNARLQLNLSSPVSYNLDPQPFDGQRVHIIDVKNNMTTYPVTINGNGRQIEGATSVTINTSGDNRSWMYRTDIGGWVKLTTLTLTDNLPFPAIFDDYFITMLAMRLSPRYGIALANETVEALKRSRSQLRSRYHAWREVQSDVDPRGMLADTSGVSYNSADFNQGRTYPWR